MRNTKQIIIAMMGLLIVACSSNQNMYQWGGGAYASSVYTALTDESNPQEELKKLEEIVQNPERKKIPPGLYAHMGLLYAKVGDTEKAFGFYQKEVELYPESRQFIEFISNK